MDWIDCPDVDLAGYNVYRSTTSGEGYIKLNSSLVTTSDYIDNTVINGTTYYYVVTAVDTSSNESQYSNERPTTPHLRSVISILGSWASGTSHTKESGTNRVLILIVHSEHNSSTTLNSVTYGGQTMTKINSIYVSTNTREEVAAYYLNEAGVAAATNGTFVPGWSATPSNVSYASVFLSNVNQSTPLGASATNSINASSPTTITTSALAANDGDMVILGATCGNPAGYTLNNGFTEALDQNMSSSQGVTGYKVSIGANETPSATNAGPNRQVITGFVIKAAPLPDLPPSVPVNLTATADIGMVTLDWNDNSETDLTGYNIYRSTTSGSGYSKLNDALIVESNYIDTNVTNGIPYYYVVTAVDYNSHESGFSVEASAVPLSGNDNCAAVQAGGYGYLADLDHNCYVDYSDLSILAGFWLNSDCGSNANCEGADFTPADGFVDFLDFSDFAGQWMQCNDPENPDCSQNW
jgi:hypothetical protein